MPICPYSNVIREQRFTPVACVEVAPEASHKIGYYEACTICNCRSITDYYSNFARSMPSAIKARKFLKLMKDAKIEFDLNNIKVRFDRKSKLCNGYLRISDELLRLLGYYISEGSLNSTSSRISLYNKQQEILNDMKYCIQNVAGIKPRERITKGFGTATELSFNHKVLFEFIKKCCNIKEDKRVPDFIFGLDKKRVGIFLSALYSGDGYISQNFVGYYTISKKLANDLAQLLLIYGIVSKISKRNRIGRNTTDYEINFYHSYKKEEFLKYVRPIGKEVNLKLFNKTDPRLIGDLYCDEVEAIEIINLDKPEYVYDIAVLKNQNFIGGYGTLLLHNSGHPSFGTMHAENVETMIRRLETEPINLSPSLVESMDAVIIMTQAKQFEKPIRKVKSVVEILKVQQTLGSVETNTPFVWDPRTDRFFFRANSKIFDKISINHGIPKQKLELEFQRRTVLLMKMFAAGITNYREVQNIINAYYKTPEIVLKKFGIR